jgi:hypothetical protein
MGSRRQFVPTLALLWLTAPVVALSQTTGVTLNPALTALGARLAGSWKCAGHFANGKAISSAEVFTSLMGGRWIGEDHTDDPPFNYVAHALFGFSDERARLTLTIFDNFGGMRLFTGESGQEGVYSFESQALDRPLAHHERFLYRFSAKGYTVEYRVEDASHAWKMGDVLDCTRS